MWLLRPFMFALLLCMALAAGRVLHAGPPDDGQARAAEPVLRSIAEVLALPAADLDKGVPVRVRGVVVFAGPFIVIQADGAGVWVRGHGPMHGASIARPGDLVEVVGVVDRGAFAPTIAPTSIEIVSQGPLPEPVAADLGRLFRGSDNGVRAEVGGMFEAVVQGCREGRDSWNLVVDMAARKIVVRIPKNVMREEPDHLVDARVKIVGVVASTRNSRGQFLAPQLWVAQADDVMVLEPAPSSPFESPRVSIEQIATYRPNPLARRRIQTEGVVTFHEPGGFCYLQEGLVGIRVDCPSAPPLTVGDVVRVAGFVDTSRSVAGIVEAIVEKTGSAAAPPPADVTPEAIEKIFKDSHSSARIAAPTNYAGVLIRFPATLVERNRFGDGWMMSLSREGSRVVARLPAAAADATRIPLGSEVEVTGVARIEADLPTEFVPVGIYPEVRPVEIMLRSAADLRLVRAPSWWTPRRLGLALAGVGSVLAAALGWVWSLRRELAAQVDRVTHEIRSRREAEVEFEATLRERNRLAANLHDTVLQTLGGIRFQIDACRVAGRATDEADAGEHFDVAKRMIDHAAQEVRGSVWALRTMPMPGRSFTDSLAAVIGQFEKRLGPAASGRIACRTTGSPVELPNFVAGNLLLVAQEAISNAIRHAAATAIDVDVAFAADGGLTLVVRDDGRGFVPGTEAGPAQGHFGLQGMRERIERLGGTFTVETAPGAGTTVTAHVGDPAGVAAQPAAAEL
jgi:signal transduction histidine kinase